MDYEPFTCCCRPGTGSAGECAAASWRCSRKPGLSLDSQWRRRGRGFQKPGSGCKRANRTAALIPNAMEPRSALAQWVNASGELTVWSTSQNPHIVRFLLSVVTGLAEHKIRVIAPEVGGGFGSKIPFYADEAITVFCAMKLGRPIKWTETRSENYQATIHGRDHIEEVELAATEDGKITGHPGPSICRNGRVSFDGGPGHPDHPAWTDVLGALHHPGHQLRGVRLVHQHYAR